MLRTGLIVMACFLGGATVVNDCAKLKRHRAALESARVFVDEGARDEMAAMLDAMDAEEYEVARSILRSGALEGYLTFAADFRRDRDLLDDLIKQCETGKR